MMPVLEMTTSTHKTRVITIHTYSVDIKLIRASFVLRAVCSFFVGCSFLVSQIVLSTLALSSVYVAMNVKRA